ncbi:MAG: glutamate racemase [Sphingomicrobium sp.]
MTPAAPLLFFDSGVGGLSVLGPTRALLPTAPIVYAADNAGFPYGTKSDAELAERLPALLDRLVGRFRPRLAVIACNTASTIALDHVRATLDIPVVGTVPAIKPAALLSKTRVIGVLGTEATVRQPYVDDLTARFAADYSVIRHGSPELVAIAEAKLAGEPVNLESVAHAVRPMLGQPRGEEIDTVVLACTHFPLIAEELGRAMPGVTFVDGGPGIARRIVWLTRDQAWPDVAPDGIALFTGAAPSTALAASLKKFGIGTITTL